MRAHEFTKRGQSRGYSFGTDKGSAAAALRDLADRLESGETVLESACVIALPGNDDFTATIVRLKIYERGPFRETTREEFLAKASRDGAPITKDTKA